MVGLAWLALGLLICMWLCSIGLGWETYKAGRKWQGIAIPILFPVVVGVIILIVELLER